MKVYVGTRTVAGALVAVQEFDARCKVLHERPLRHHVRHSPTGMEFGYAGSGPADLARSLLIDALGPRAICVACDGRGVVVWDDDEGDFRAATSDFDLQQAEKRAHKYEDYVVACFDCDKSVITLPYMRFKADVVARLPREGFTLPAADVVAWYEEHEGAKVAGK